MVKARAAHPQGLVPDQRGSCRSVEHVLRTAFGQDESCGSGSAAVVIDRPAQIAGDRLVHHIGVVAAHHGDVVFKAVLRDEAQQLAQALDAGDGDAAVHGKGVVGELALAQIAFHSAPRGRRWTGGNRSSGRVSPCP